MIYKFNLDKFVDHFLLNLKIKTEWSWIMLKSIFNGFTSDKSRVPMGIWITEFCFGWKHYYINQSED